MPPKRRNQSSEAGPSRPAKVARVTRSSTAASNAQARDSRGSNSRFGNAQPVYIQTDTGTSEIADGAGQNLEETRLSRAIREFMEKEAEWAEKGDEDDYFLELPKRNHKYVTKVRPFQNPRALFDDRYYHVKAPAPTPKGKKKREHPMIEDLRMNGNLNSTLEDYWGGMPNHDLLPLAGRPMAMEDPHPRFGDVRAAHPSRIPAGEDVEMEDTGVPVPTNGTSEVTSKTKGKRPAKKVTFADPIEIGPDTPQQSAKTTLKTLRRVFKETLEGSVAGPSRMAIKDIASEARRELRTRAAAKQPFPAGTTAVKQTTSQASEAVRVEAPKESSQAVNKKPTRIRLTGRYERYNRKPRQTLRLILKK